MSEAPTLTPACARFEISQEMIQTRDEDSRNSDHQEEIRIWQKWKQLTEVLRERVKILE